MDLAFAGADDLVRAWREGLTPDPALTVSAWADRHRILSPRGSSEAGPWRTSRTPYLQELMDALSPRHPAQRVVFMKGSQLGASESGCCWIGYVIHHAPGPMLAVQPSVELAKRFSQQRIDPLIEESPALREKVAPARSRDSGNTVLSKEFPGGILVLTGANSAVGLRSMPVRYLFLDEVDAYPPSADDEGDPVALAEARTRTFSWRRKVFLASTPTIKGLSRIEREYQASDQRRFFVPCPHCGHAQWLKFERLRWDKGQPETAAYVCEACEQPIAEHHKTKMLAEGEWRPTAISADPLSIGFHLSSLYSPVGWLSWERIAREWEACQSSDEAKRSFINTVLGETWAETGEAPDWQRLYERREGWRRGTVPGLGLILTAGADIQKDRIEVSIWAWGRELESWLVDHVVVEAGPGTTGAVLGKVALGAATPAAFAGNAANTGTIATVSLGAGAKAGVYRLVIIEPASNAGTFTVEDPDGVTIGTGTVGVEFTAGGLTFTLADGATDFKAGEGFTLTVAAGSGKYRGYNPANTDGSQAAVAVLFAAVDAAAADRPSVAIVRDAEVNAAELSWFAGATAEQKAAGLAQLALAHIIGR